MGLLNLLFIGQIPFKSAFGRQRSRKMLEFKRTILYTNAWAAVDGNGTLYLSSYGDMEYRNITDANLLKALVKLGFTTKDKVKAYLEYREELREEDILVTKIQRLQDAFRSLGISVPPSVSKKLLAEKKNLKTPRHSELAKIQKNLENK